MAPHPRKCTCRPPWCTQCSLIATSPSQISYHMPGLEREKVQTSTTLKRRLHTIANHKKPKDVRWGFELAPTEKKITCFKLFLDRDIVLPSFIDEIDIAEQLKEAGRSEADATFDFLTKLNDHILDNLRKRLGEDFMDTTEVEYVLTVPVIWSEKAKIATLRAANAAGMQSVKVMTEPEAAATYVIANMREKSLKIGDCITVCDAGGGTVDVVSYMVAKLSPLAVEQAHCGIGDLCGANFLNFEFENLVKTRLGPEGFRRMKELPRTWQTCLNTFEDYVKRNFQSKDVHDFPMPLPGMPDDETTGIADNFLNLSHDDVKSIFEPIVGRVLDLVERQVKALQASGKKISAIMLCGGFGQSRYLFDRMNEHFNNDPKSGVVRPAKKQRTALGSSQVTWSLIKVIQPTNAWTAVVRGAVMRGLEQEVESVKSRVLRSHYGVKCDAPFDEKKHPLSSRVLGSVNGEFRATDAMEWFFPKGATVAAEQTHSLTMSLHFANPDPNAVKPQEKVVQHILYASDGEDAPKVFTKDLRHMLKVTADLAGVPATYYERHTPAKAKQFCTLTYTLQLRVDAAGLRFEVLVGGIAYGRYRQNDAICTGTPQGSLPRLLTHRSSQDRTARGIAGSCLYMGRGARPELQFLSRPSSRGKASSPRPQHLLVVVKKSPRRNASMAAPYRRDLEHFH
ncbi:hypothetical protein MRB53_040362 [Persea americana]|nr:hypothetical protein MRB53_040362 [Persea americana]